MNAAVAIALIALRDETARLREQVDKLQDALDAANSKLEYLQSEYNEIDCALRDTTQSELDWMKNKYE
jgi:predicted  nucleic acid-binding Zn-ribbon protein